MIYATQKSREKLVTLKEVRKKLNITQEQLAKRLGTHRPNISDIERGVEIPDWMIKALVLHRLLRQAGYTLDDLLLSLPDPDDLPRAAEAARQYRTD